MFSTERVTANTLESFLFIAVLLVFGLMAAGYVLADVSASPPTVCVSLRPLFVTQRTSVVSSLRPLFVTRRTSV
eukprot:4069846-Pyramimonas_sp.AAC.1